MEYINVRLKADE